MKLPSLQFKEAKSGTFLSYSFGLLVLSILGTSDATDKKVLWLFAAISFGIASVKYLWDNIKLPLIPCKNRCNKLEGPICIRDIGYISGAFISIIALLLLKLFQIKYSFDKTILLFVALASISTTIIHGTARRHLKVVNSNSRFDKALTYIVGLFTGFALFFMALYFI